MFCMELTEGTRANVGGGGGGARAVMFMVGTTGTAGSGRWGTGDTDALRRLSLKTGAAALRGGATGAAPPLP